MLWSRNNVQHRTLPIHSDGSQDLLAGGSEGDGNAGGETIYSKVKARWEEGRDYA